MTSWYFRGISPVYAFYFTKSADQLTFLSSRRSARRLDYGLGHQGIVVRFQIETRRLGSSNDQIGYAANIAISEAEQSHPSSE